MPFPPSPIVTPPKSGGVPVTSTGGGSPDTKEKAPVAAGAPASGVLAFTFYATPADSTAAGAMLRPGLAAASVLPMPYRGSVVGLVLQADADKTAGKCHFAVQKNGVSTSAILDWSDSASVGTTQFVPGDYGFVRDDTVNVVYNTDARYSPTTTKVEVTLYVVLDQSEV